MLDRLAHGAEIVLRSGATTALLGLRWAHRLTSKAAEGIPSPHRGLAVFTKTVIDEIFFATELISAPFVSRRDRTRVVEELHDAIELYEERGWLEDPRSYHLTPPPIEQSSVRSWHSHWVDYEHLSFESEYEPHVGEPGRERWLDYATNRTAHAWLVEHPGKPRPWLVCVPGYRMGYPAVDFTGFRAAWLHRKLGLNVAIPVLPLHGPRRVGRRGGDGFLTGDFVDTVHAQTQAVWDTRRLANWLREHGAPSVGMYGVSLGGYTTALVAALEENLDCVIAGIPAADFVRLFQAHVPKFLLNTMEWFGLSLESVARLLRVISPLALPPRVPRSRRYLYAGLADHLASPDHARDLWRHWERPQLTWYQGGHVSFLWEAEVRELLQNALTSCGLTIHRTSH